MGLDAQEIGGILPILYSFFDEEGRLRHDGFEHQIEHCMGDGASGIVLFGFVTQFYRLTFEEKREIAVLCSRILRGRGSFGVTIMEPSLEAQVALIRIAEEAGADWIILQPPLGPPSPPALWLEMLRRAAAATALPVAVQNATIAGTTLSNEQLLALQDSQPNIRLCKAEADSADVAAFAAEFGERFRVITGNWGVEYPLFRQAGAHGLIPAPNFVAEQAAIHRASDPGNPDTATVDRIHESILPLLQMLRERAALEDQIQLGKYIYHRRTGYPLGGNRLPGPQRLNPFFARHIDRLCERLQAAGGISQRIA